MQTFKEIIIYTKLLRFFYCHFFALPSISYDKADQGIYGCKTLF